MSTLINVSEMKELRVKLRNNTTPPEQKFWYYLRNKQFYGIKFRRQCSIVHYIVDFYSFERKLVIELDGDSHFETEADIEYDRKRTQFLEFHGLHVLRFMNIDIVNNIEGCLEILTKYCFPESEL